MTFLAPRGDPNLGFKFEAVEAWDAKRKRNLGRYWAVTGLSEFERIVMGCTSAAYAVALQPRWHRRGVLDILSVGSLARGTRLASRRHGLIPWCAG